MAKRGSGCTPKRITFKAHGKTVSFMGRPGGMKSAGGKCSDKRRSTAHLRSYKSAFKSAVKACKSKSHKRAGKRSASPFNKCVGSKL